MPRNRPPSRAPGHACDSPHASGREHEVPADGRHQAERRGLKLRRQVVAAKHVDFACEKRVERRNGMRVDVDVAATAGPHDGRREVFLVELRRAPRGAERRQVQRGDEPAQNEECEGEVKVNAIERANGRRLPRASWGWVAQQVALIVVGLERNSRR